MNLYEYIQFSDDGDKKKKKPGFLRRHWKKLALGAGAVALGGLTAANVIRGKRFGAQAAENAQKVLELSPELNKREKREARWNKAVSGVDKVGKGISYGLGKTAEGIGKFGRGVAETLGKVGQKFKKDWDESQARNKAQRELDQRYNSWKKSQKDMEKAGKNAFKQANKDSRNTQNEINKMLKNLNKNQNKPLVEESKQKAPAVLEGGTLV